MVTQPDFVKLCKLEQMSWQSSLVKMFFFQTPAKEAFQIITCTGTNTSQYTNLALLNQSDFRSRTLHFIITFSEMGPYHNVLVKYESE